jgi:putative sterol carrier protein
MAFADAEELYKVFGLTMDKAMKDKAFAAKLSAANLVVGLSIPNIDAFITLECLETLKVSFGPPTIDIDVTAVNNDENFNKFWQGKLNLMTAMAKGLVKAQGAVFKMLKVLPIIDPMYPMFTESLKEAGREDLVVK